MEILQMLTFTVKQFHSSEHSGIGEKENHIMLKQQQQKLLLKPCQDITGFYRDIRSWIKVSEFGFFFFSKKTPVQTVIISDGMREIHLALFNKSRQVLLSNEPVDISGMTERVGKEAGSFHDYT